MYSPGGHRERAGEQPGDPGQQHEVPSPCEAPATPITSDEVRHEPVARPRRSRRAAFPSGRRGASARWRRSRRRQVVAASATSRATLGDYGRSACLARPASPSSRFQISACSRSSAAIASPPARGLGRVEVLLVALERLDHVADGVRPEEAGEQHDRSNPQPRSGRLRDRRAELAQLAGPDLRVAALVARDGPEAPARRGSFSMRDSPSYSAIASRSSFRFSRLWSMSMAGIDEIVTGDGPPGTAHPGCYDRPDVDGPLGRQGAALVRRR